MATYINEDLINREQYCTVCTKPLDAERIKFRSVTCSKECQSVRQRMLRKRVDDRECRFCHKPSTPAARAAFMRFRKWERTNPDQAYPEVWAIVKAAGVTLYDFAQAVAQSVKRDVILDPAMSDIDWGSTKPRKEDDAPTPELDRVLELLREYQAKQTKPAKEDAA